MKTRLLITVSVFAVAIIAVIVISVLENESSLTEQEIRESIQNEISKSPKITGVLAQNICEIIDLECPSNKTFQAVIDPNDGSTKFNYVKNNNLQYYFRIIDEQIEYKTNRNPTEWRTFGDDRWMWDPINDDDLTVQEYSRTFHFEDDELGNYEQWCHDSSGIFSKDHLGSVTCKFTDPLVYKEARDALHELQEKTISGELAQRLCAAYGKECLPGISITMEYDMKTGYLLKDKKIEEQYYEFRIIEDDVIQYRTGHYPSSPWTTFLENEN